MKKILGKIYLIGIIICISIAAFFSYKLINEYMIREKGANEFKQLAQLVDSNSDSNKDTDNEGNEKTDEEKAKEKYMKAYEINEDLVGWIYINGTNIDFPVVQSKYSPNFYLRRDFNKEYSILGVPYASEQCDVDMSDNVIIYGHNIRGGKMFAELENYESYDFYKNHKTINFDTLNSLGEYKVVAVFKVNVDEEKSFEYYNFINASSKDEFEQFIQKCKQLSFYNIDEEVDFSDKLITLSTCEYTYNDGRLVVVAKKIK